MWWFGGSHRMAMTWHPLVIQFPRYDRPTCQKRWVYVPPWHYFPSFLYLLSGKSEAMRKCMLSAVFVWLRLRTTAVVAFSKPVGPTDRHQRKKKNNKLSHFFNNTWEWLSVGHQDSHPNKSPANLRTSLWFGRLLFGPFAKCSTRFTHCWFVCARGPFFTHLASVRFMTEALDTVLGLGS